MVFLFSTQIQKKHATTTTHPSTLLRHQAWPLHRNLTPAKPRTHEMSLHQLLTAHSSLSFLLPDTQLTALQHQHSSQALLTSTFSILSVSMQTMKFFLQNVSVKSRSEHPLVDLTYNILDLFVELFLLSN